jgi:hypothetical protein
MMAGEQLVLMAVKATILNLEPEDRTLVEECAGKIRDLVYGYDDFGPIALALVGAEAAAGALDND